MSSNSFSEHPLNEGNFTDVDCTSSSHPRNISVSRRNSQQSSSSSSNNALHSNAANTQSEARGQTLSELDQKESRLPGDCPMRTNHASCRGDQPAHYRSQQPLPVSKQCCLDDLHTLSTSLSQMGHCSCQQASSSSIEHQAQFLPSTSLEHHAECTGCANNADLRGYSVALISPNGTIIPTTTVCPGTVMSAGSCTTVGAVSPPSSGNVEHSLQYSHERLPQMAHSVSSQYIHSSNSSVSDIFAKSPFKNVSCLPGGTPPDNLEFPTLPCQIVPTPPDISPEKLLEMANTLPSGFPSYLLPLREAVQVEENLKMTTKPILKPVASHENVDLDVLLPNGCFLTVPVFDDDTLTEIKRKLWIKYKEMLKDTTKTDSQNTSNENIFLTDTNQTLTNSQLLDTNETTVNENKKSSENSKKLLKKQSFNVRSPSLNFNKLNPWVDKREIKLKKEEKEEVINASEETDNDETFMRTYSMRQKVENFMKSKFSKTGSIRVSSNDGYTKNAFFTTPFKNIAKNSTSISTPVSPVDMQTSCSDTFNFSSFADSQPLEDSLRKNNTLETGGKSSKLFSDSSKSKSQVAVEPLPIETTASLVLADFETDLTNNRKIMPTVQSKLGALATEDVADYAFSGITGEAKNEEFYDDNLRLIDLDLFIPMLKLIEVVGNKQEKMVNSAISQIVGKSLGELERNKTTEFSQFRASMHLTMLSSVKERESLSVDGRIFYEYPPEMDEFETLQLSTRKIRKDIEAYRSDAQNCSTEAWMSSSCDSLTDEGIYCDVNNFDLSKHETDDVSTSKLDSANKSKTAKTKSQQLKKSSIGETDAEYMEVIALKNSNRVVQKHCQTEYPLVLLGKQICTKENNDSKKKEKKKSDKKETKFELLKTETKSEKTIPFKESCQKSSSLLSQFNFHTTSKEKNVSTNETKLPNKFEDHYEICFDRSSQSSASDLSVSKLQKNYFHIWSSLVTLLHGGCHGRIKECGYGNLVYLFDQICNAETNPDGKNSKYNSDNSFYKSQKFSKNLLFKSIFRKPRYMHPIEEKAQTNFPINSSTKIEKNTLSNSFSLSSNIFSHTNVPSTSQADSNTLQQSTSQPISKSVSFDKELNNQFNKLPPNLDNQPGAKTKKYFPEIDSEIKKKFDVHPHLLPQLYPVKCHPETMRPYDLIDEVLKHYLVWLRTWFQENIKQATAADGTANSVLSTTSLFSSANDSIANDNNISSFSKTLTKFLSPKSSTSANVDSSDINNEEIQESAAYVEMFIGTASSFNDNNNAKQQQTKTNQKQLEPTKKTSKLSEQTQSISKFAAALSRNSTLSLSSKSMKLKNNIAQLKALYAKLDQDIGNFSADRYLLKICGYEQYIVGECPLNSFEYIRSCVSKNKAPQLMLISKIAIIQKIPNYVFNFPPFFRRKALNDAQLFPGLPLPMDNFTEVDFAKKALQMLIEGKTSFQQTFEGKEISLGGPPFKSRNAALTYHGHRIVSKTTSHKKVNNVQSKTAEAETAASESNYAVICHSQATATLSSSEKVASLSEGNISSDVSVTSSIDTKPKFNYSDINDDMSFERWESLSTVEKKLASVWTFQSPFRVKVLLAQYVNVKDVDRIYVAASVYHGSEKLCMTQTTRRNTPQNPRWDEMIEFPDLLMQDIPLSSVLSISMCAQTSKHKFNEEFATSYVNLQLFDYNRCMISGKFNMCMWPMPKGVDGLMNPHGLSGANPNRLTSSRIILEFDTFSKPIVYPPESAIVQFAKDVNQKEQLLKTEVTNFYKNNETFEEREDDKVDFSIVFANVEAKLKLYEIEEYKAFFMRCSKSRYYRNAERKWKAVKPILEKAATQLDPFFQLNEQEKDFFWRERFHIRKRIPDALPKVLESCRWNFKEEASQMYSILTKWPMVSVDIAIILLNARYLDSIVRQFAVRSLDRGLTDALLESYLIQLVQLLKNEPHLDNALARFLLRRALLSRRFGHYFFWTLKSQMDDPSCANRWFVMLEMYLRGLSPTALKITLAQVSALDEIERIGNTTAHERDQTEAIKKLLNRPDIQVKVNKLYNPLNIGIPMEKLLADKFRVMDSAKKPMWLEWSNPDPFAGYNNQEICAVIYKIGDDLRQDMITLEVIRLMDIIWRKEGLDLKMMPYRCIATGQNIGLIEVVKHAKTVMGIQRVGGRMAALQVDNSKLHKWIKEHNPDSYDNAVENFTRSCAGYCVATYVLGIADRHNDNIMINENGQIFHIDFGHFLGHFKKKLGINRERVPFVLTYDFLSVITKGAENPLITKEFQDFQQLCYDAYLALHDNAHLLVSLFVMMLGIGIPELQALDDVQYLRRTLQVDAATREEARSYFEKQLDEAHGGAWSTKLDWFFHSVKHA